MCCAVWLVVAGLLVADGVSDGLLEADAEAEGEAVWGKSRCQVAGPTIPSAVIPAAR